MRPHLHVDQLAGSPRELAGDRLRFAGQSYEELMGGGAMPTLTSAPTAGGGITGGIASGQGPHHGIVVIVLLAVLALVLLDKAGFRFAVTAGRH